MREELMSGTESREQAHKTSNNQRYCYYVAEIPQGVILKLDLDSNLIINFLVTEKK